MVRPKIVTKRMLRQKKKNRKLYSMITALGLFLLLGLNQVKLTNESEARLIEANMILQQQVWDTHNKLLYTINE